MTQHPVISGIDSVEGIRRTGGNPALYDRFLRRFPDDPSFHQLCTALRDGDVRQAFSHAHTLKGLTAQLCIHALFLPAGALCDLLRSQDPRMLPLAQEQLFAMIPVYEEITARIRSLP